MKLTRFFLFSVFTLSVLNCAELFQSRDKKDNTDALLVALFASPGCGSSAVSGSAGNGTRYLFSGCSGDPTSVLRAFGFTSSGVTFNAGIQGTSAASTIVTNASSLSSSGNDSKAGIEITYVMNQGDSFVDALLQSTSSFAGPGVQFSPTQSQWLNGSTPSAFVTTPSIAWSSSVGIEKTVCIEVHKENANAHIFGWSIPCNSVNRSSYEFEQEDAVITGFTGDRVGLKINKAVIKSITIYSTVIGTAGSFQ
ncbi:hypothetical protein EHQ23_10560 [Leptospira bourretii]|uniref:Uncharacterized protein n=1 Tax=Leptospira bourretii TaxID=2484962 RepID=A0A4R9IML4_9LEPT|nr:hypothetical protein [Leptospira bourretii]TGK85107.1 hypothetical protein EHQ23_10560 [Leptospira bourretii]TGK90872.1 hypothetical protein EHQ26_12160 [Leptospira bourretii]TGL23391.1 hypothetical protein EHQ47_05810 [Leptospira bourretii]TGL31225.1 hypothetical protein EHQ45_12230 [Leptospira bourretii]